MSTKNYLAEFIFLFLIYTKSSQSLNIHCEFRDAAWVVVNVKYTCITLSFSDLGNPRVQSVTGVHSNGRSNANVEAIDFWGPNELSFFPQNLQGHIPNILAMRFDTTRLTSITAEDFRPFPNLFVFASRYNSISSLPANLFQHVPRLEYLVVTSSPALQHVGQNILGNLPRLNYANFAENSCISYTARNRDEINYLNSILHQRCQPATTTTRTTTTTTRTTTASTNTRPTNPPPTSPPPTQPPPIDYCPSACSADISNLDRKIRNFDEIVGELRWLIDRNSQSITDHSELIQQNSNTINISNGMLKELNILVEAQQFIIERHEEVQRNNTARIDELEILVRELTVRPSP